MISEKVIKKIKNFLFSKYKNSIRRKYKSFGKINEGKKSGKSGLAWHEILPK